ncbi:MAG: CmcJ/NvfI family oxidoreductase [Myxococcota bacterium]
MTRSATVNYHVRRGGRPVYEIDAGGVVGEIVSPEHAKTVVAVGDVRGGEVSVSFRQDGLMFEHAPSRVASFDGENWRTTYESELGLWLRDKLGAREVLIFDHTVREDDQSSTRQPARNVHTDYSPDGAQQRLTDLLGAGEADEWARGHYAFINLWRPIGRTVNSAPLGFVRPASVSADDWMLIDVVYPDRVGHIMGLAASDRHEWIYLSCMSPDELVAFNIYDNLGLPSVAHSALNLTEDEHERSTRRSIESRALVRY